MLEGCAAPAPEAGSKPQTTAAPARTEQNRPLMMALRPEPATLALRPIQGSLGVSNGVHTLLFNIGLGREDEAGVVQPGLAGALPQLNTDTWRVTGDGRMETVYRLRPNLAWHDGTPLSAEDFVFSWRVYSTPALGGSGTPPISLIEDVVAPDAQTVTIHWKRVYVQAGTLSSDLPALPRHLLEASFNDNRGDSFATHPYWTTDYVGLGPYKVERWEQGSFIEATAFDRYALGAPRIQRIVVRFMVDENAVLASMLAGETEIAPDGSVQFNLGVVIRREWAPKNGGTVLIAGTQLEGTYPQMRPEYQQNRALLDVRVRSALAHAIDKQALNDGLFDGEWTTADNILNPSIDYFGRVEPRVAKYPFDLRRSEQLLAEAGFTKGSDGLYASPTLGRLSFEHKVNDGAQNVNEGAILSKGWRDLGIDVQEAVLPRAQIQNGEVRNTYPGIFTYSSNGDEGVLDGYIGDQIGRPENRWAGNNRGGWVSPEYDRLHNAYSTTLETGPRVDYAAQMVKLVNDELPVFVLYFRPRVVPFISALQGPTRLSPRGWVGANIHEWQWK
jgi:peptide/nickel transport system substrate-binding protein